MTRRGREAALWAALMLIAVGAVGLAWVDVYLP